MDEGRFARTLRANNGNDGEIDVVVEPFGCWLDELGNRNQMRVILTRCRGGC